MHQLENTATVSPIRLGEDGRYTWTVTRTEFGETIATEYFTDKGAEGLWPTRQNGDFKQLPGHGQFSLKDCSASTRRQRVLKATADRA
ncbi:hypothetical protein ASH00_15890 [Arthrobacter sp. Soil782]|uniref:hypothetical protein n=1 Tax=Arthrobacter sp. Soil782 TaxID=1736410 RepID=UPI0006F5F358|nr:hypothetical protein [Arthrobacter sp. Soil782]KRF03266.1 hypothetical protein ASH00_15890 [Arthrobacter sp. Soil782]